MAVFHYRGRNNEGLLKEGQLTASSIEAVIDTLMHKGITPIEIEDIRIRKKPFSFLNKKIFVSKVKPMDLMIFCRQMHTLLKSGIPLTKAVSLILETTRSERLANSLKDIIADVTGGKTLTSAISKFPDTFPPLFISLIDAAENSGQLEAVFLQLVGYLELVDRTTKQIKTATRYPTFVIGAVIVALCIINFFIIPNFAGVFSKFGLELPLPTRILLATSNFLINDWQIMLIAVFGLIICTKLYLRTDKGRYIWDRFKLKIPIIGPIINRILLGRLTRSFAMILRTGVPLNKGIELISNIADNEYMRIRILKMRDGIERGEPLTQTAIDTGLFSSLVLQMFSTGEESGDIDRLLQEAAEFYEREVEYDLKQLGDAIEPILLSVMGGLVLILAMGIFLPMWEMVEIIRK